jgi:hypothetical protein
MLTKISLMNTWDEERACGIQAKDEIQDWCSKPISSIYNVIQEN